MALWKTALEEAEWALTVRRGDIQEVRLASYLDTGYRWHATPSSHIHADRERPVSPSGESSDSPLEFAFRIDVCGLGEASVHSPRTGPASRLRCRVACSACISSTPVRKPVSVRRPREVDASASIYGTLVVAGTILGAADRG